MKKKNDIFQKFLKKRMLKKQKVVDFFPNSQKMKNRKIFSRKTLSASVKFTNKVGVGTLAKQVQLCTTL